MSKKRIKTFPAKVDKIIKPIGNGEPEKAQITVEPADHLYRELRVENKLQDENGHEVRLKPGAQIEVKIEADAEATTSGPGKS